MNALLRKEFKLAVHLTSYLFLPLALMFIIPNYPYYVIFFYQTLGIFFMFLNGNTNNDVFFTALLPVRKRDAVTARVISVVALEMLQIVVSIPFACLRNAILPGENLAGMEANAALFGLSLAMLGIFNITFLPGFYKTAYKTGGPFLVACGAMTLFVVAAEVVIHVVPGWAGVLDTLDPAGLPQQIGTLGIGALAYALLTVGAHAQSVRRFERLDL